MEIREQQTVEITRAEYERLLYAQRQLDHLESEGVDNWCGYSRVSRYEEDEE